MIEIGKLPEGIREKVIEDIKKHGEWSTSHFLYMAPFGRMLQELKPSDTDFVWYIVTLHLINLFGSKDPLPIHFTIARESLKSLKIEKDKAVDMLARELVLECQNFRELIFKEFSINNMSIVINNQTVDLVHDKELLLPEKDALPALICVKDGCNTIDLIFSDFLKDLGLHGKEAAKIIKESSPSRHQKYRESGYTQDYRQEAWSVWIPNQLSSLLSPFLNVLSNVVWNDKCKQRWEREKRNVPALAQGVVVKTIKPPLSKESKIEVLGNSINCYSKKGEIISSVPCIDPKLVNLICKGLELFSSLTGHKLLRWQVKTGFSNWASGIEDPRLIPTSGGYEGIASLVGCRNSKKSPTEIKALLHAQAYGHFNFPQGGTGNMIILREIEKHKNGEPSKINIILGEMLLPNFTHQLPPGEKRRLVPITELPPLIGSKNTHAAQAMLQLLILEEFSNQSDRLASKKCVLIPLTKWEQLAVEAKLPQSCLNKVIMGWTEGNLFSKAFLQKKGDEYTLGMDYSQVIDFLEYQGQQRIDGAKGGCKSAKKKFISKNFFSKRIKD
ncbi:MAG: hypothetical protein ACRDAI_00115 [Candidatus Rhabdochlamydia sp.]